MSNPVYLEINVNINKNEHPMITSGLTIRILFPTKKEFFCLFDFKEYIPNAPNVPKIAENNPQSNATTIVLITITIIRVFLNKST